MNKMMIIGGTLIEPGEVREVHLSISEGANSRPVLLPITVIRGVKEGPTLFFTGAVHGDELNGTAILRELLSRVHPSMLKGTLILAPLVNVFGFQARTRYLPDGRDLNRYFPGRHDGNMSQRIAYRIFHELVRNADFGVDLHTAPYGRENFPHIRADLSKPKVRKLARAFGASVILNDRGKTGMLRRAASEAGIPSIVFEGGTANKFQRPIVRSGLEGILELLVRMKMLQRKTKRARRSFRIIVQKTEWIRAERGGLLELKTHPGGLLYKGDVVAQIFNPLGRDVHVLISPITGLVIGVNTSPVATPGTPIAHVVELQKTLPTVEKAIAEGSFHGMKL